MIGRLDTKIPDASWLSHSEKLTAEAESRGNNGYLWGNRTANKSDGFVVTEIYLRLVKRLKS